MARRIAWIAAIAAVLVFAALAAALLASASSIRIPAITALVTASAIALSHLGGVHAGLALHEKAATNAARAAAMAWGIAVSLAAWGVLWLPTPRWQVGASLALFVALWIGGKLALRAGLMPPWFHRLRGYATVAACAILALAWALF